MLSIDGHEDCYVEIRTNETVGALKKAIKCQIGMSCENQILIFMGKTLNQDTAVLASIGIKHNVSISVSSLKYGGENGFKLLLTNI